MNSYKKLYSTETFIVNSPSFSEKPIPDALYLYVKIFQIKTGTDYFDISINMKIT